jgi:hypothetical protein
MAEGLLDEVGDPLLTLPVEGGSGHHKNDNN